MNIYDVFLQEVISKNNDEFQEPYDVVSRFKTLKDAQQLLLQGNKEQSNKLKTISE